MRSMVGLCLLLYVGASHAGTLRDDFSDGNSDGWRIAKLLGQGTTWTVEDERLVAKSVGACAWWPNALLIGGDTWRDYSIEVRIMVVEAFPIACQGAGVGGLVHAADVGAISLSGLSCFGASRDPFLNRTLCYTQPLEGDFQLDDDRTFAVEPNRWYTMRIVAGAKDYRMFGDDVLICETERQVPDRGAAGLTVRNAEVHFDDVVITGPNVPDVGLLSVNSTDKAAATWAQIKRLH